MGSNVTETLVFQYLPRSSLLLLSEGDTVNELTARHIRSIEVFQT